MGLKLIHLEQRIKELEILADEVLELGERLSKRADVQPDLSVKGQSWYRGCRELLLQQNFSGIKEFDDCYRDCHRRRSFADIERYINYGPRELESISGKEQSSEEYFQLFSSFFQKARSLLRSVVDEINSRELPITTELSFYVSANEFDTSKDIFEKYNTEEVFLRVSGVVARIALVERIVNT